MDEPLVLVLVADRAAREPVTRLVRSRGVEVRTFASAETFFAQPLPDRPACLVVDVELPDASGLAVQERLVEAGPDLPIVFVAARADVPTSVCAMKRGAVDFLEKPIDGKQLGAAVDAALTRAATLREARGERRRAEALVAALTPRERQVLALLMAGLPNKVSAVRLGVTEKTVKVHRAQVMRKTKAGSLARLVVLGRQAGVLGAGPASGASASLTAARLRVSARLPTSR